MLPENRGDRLREVSGLERCPEKTMCPEKRGGRIREVAVSGKESWPCPEQERCPEKRGDRIREVSGKDRWSD